MSLRSKVRPNKRQYEDLNDSRDTRVPLHNDAAFMHGLSFTAKFIGSLEVSKPSSRVEIVSCMRRIRYEFRAKSVKKVKSSINISVSGVKVTKYIKKKKRKRKKNPEQVVVEPPIILESPIYRIFYVSHDSLDKKIFSFICRVESGNNRKTFVCAVFKAYKKSHALRIVRTIGQAFDICCKLQQSPDAANIPGLLPPEKLKKMQEKKDGDEGTGIDDDVDGPSARNRLSTSPGELLNNFNLDASILETTELPPNAIVTFEDDYEVNLLEYQKHLYSFGQSLLLNSAEVQQSTNEETLLDGYKLTPALRQLMVLQFRLKQDQNLGNVFMPPGDTQTNLARQDSVLSKPLPTPPPNRLKVGNKKFSRPGVGVTENANRDDSVLLGKADGGLEAMAADNVPTDLLVDTSIPEEPAKPINPFTSVTLLEDDETPAPKNDSQWVEMQRAQTAQLQLLKDQLSSETAARIDAQSKTHHVLRQNKIMAAYVMHLSTQLKRQKEASATATTNGGGADGGQVITTSVFTAPAEDSEKTTVLQAATDTDGTPGSLPGATLEPTAVTSSGETAAAPAAALPASDMELLADILATSSIQPSQPPADVDDDFKPRQQSQTPEQALAGKGGDEPAVTTADRFSPFHFDGNKVTSSTPTANNDDDSGAVDGRFSPFEGFGGDEKKPPAPEGNSRPGSQPTGRKSEEPIVLFELPSAPTPQSDLDGEDGTAPYAADGPAYMPLDEIEVE